MQDELEAVVDVLSHSGFLTGLVIGLVGGLVLFAAGLVANRPPMGWGITFAATVGLGLRLQFDIDTTVLVFVGGLALIGMIGDLVHAVSGRSVVAVSVGFWVLATIPVFWLANLPPLSEVAWADVVFPLAILVTAVGVWLLSQSSAATLMGPMVAISVAGIWATVPETDMITVLLGAAIPLGLATLPPVRGRALMAGALSLAGVLAWMVLVEGEPRPWTIAGSWAALASLPVFGILVRVRPNHTNVHVLAGAHLVYVLAATRVADSSDSPRVVAAAVGVLLVVSTAAVLVASRIASRSQVPI